MLFDKKKYYELSEEIREKIVKYYIIYIILFTLLGIITTNIIELVKDNSMIKILIIFVSILIGVLLAHEKEIDIEIKEQNMKWKIEIYEILNKLEKK